jgi:hypothetical protein
MGQAGAGAGSGEAGSGSAGGVGNAGDGAAGTSAGVAGNAGMGAMAGAAGEAGSGSAGDGSAGDGSAGTSGSDDFEALRQTCVDTINMHRATLGLAPMVRGTDEQEQCADRGAKKDGDSGNAHSSAGDCSGLGAQNTCPGWGVGGFSGYATVADALDGCLQAMWDEGEPPVPVDECIDDYVNCFLKHGHYINMTGKSRVAACGFYQMSNGRWWMNQNFGR